MPRSGTRRAGQGALLSHRSAAWLWGIDRTLAIAGRSHGAPARGTTSRRHLVSHSCRSASRRRSDHRRTGIPVTAVPRTLLDFAAADAAIISLRRWTTPSGSESARHRRSPSLSSISRSRRTPRGVGTASQRHGATTSDPAFTRSGLERRFLRLVEEARICHARQPTSSSTATSSTCTGRRSGSRSNSTPMTTTATAVRVRGGPAPRRESGAGRDRDEANHGQAPRPRTEHGHAAASTGSCPARRSSRFDRPCPDKTRTRRRLG